ncbi:MAG TPA: family 20 glycosylhydrolase, partial [Chitinophagaceae bacterium]|nr:family 20 glycosylhydrolase [Chitinophagaceae bacterium]
KSKRVIALLLEGKEADSANEAYTLQAGPEGVQIKASSLHGIFNGIQTLRQLMQTGRWVKSCHIYDWPAFSWRGYMIDVGRNYMPMNLLKQQIEVMAAYKLNIFHFHATEDIAWRWYINRYPQLTEAQNMLRNKGSYYSEKEIKELIEFCRQRYIQFVPEIDMPGHSAAFRRAMHTDMQSDSGMLMVKNILEEIVQRYDLPYIHIGADEVKISNKRFIPEMTEFLQQRGKKLIGWEPGGNFLPGTIRQLWMDDQAFMKEDAQIQFIDSRHLYLNHMDPLEAVTTIYNRMIGNKPKGDSSLLGATLCMWNDRRVDKPADILRMNPVYSGMLAFAERLWQGGGQKGWISNISDGNIHAFEAFEQRLIRHKKRYFADKPFPYYAQLQQRWHLLGPFPNGGNLSNKMPVESNSLLYDTATFASVTGGTVVLRHWWYPLIKGAVQQPKESSTVYAYTRLWSNSDTVQDFWIGFNDLSRSPATDSPPEGEWDAKMSRIWLNGQPIDPPHWLHGGQKGNSEVPL